MCWDISRWHRGHTEASCLTHVESSTKAIQIVSLHSKEGYVGPTQQQEKYGPRQRILTPRYENHLLNITARNMGITYALLRCNSKHNRLLLTKFHHVRNWSIMANCQTFNCCRFALKAVQTFESGVVAKKFVFARITFSHLLTYGTCLIWSWASSLPVVRPKFSIVCSCMVPACCEHWARLSTWSAPSSKLSGICSGKNRDNYCQILARQAEISQKTSKNISRYFCSFFLQGHV